MLFNSSTHNVHYIHTYVCIFLIKEYAPLKPKKRDNKENMMDAIFMAKKKRCGCGNDCSCSCVLLGY